MLYQQNQKIEVIVRKEDSGGAAIAGANETPVEETAGGGGENTFLAKITGTTSKRKQYRVLKTNATHAWAVVRQIAGLEINYFIGGIGYKNGDAALQDAVQREYEIYQDSTSVASSIAMGALYGSWGGPLGAVLGATLNGVSTAVSIGVKYKAREREYNVKMFKEENGIEYLRARASINLTTGRLR